MDILEKLKKQFFKKKVLIVGLGLLGGGVGLAKFFSEVGARVRVTDKKNETQLFQSINRLKHWPIEFSLGKHQLSDFLWPDVIFKGPSVAWDLPEIVTAQKQGIPVEMELSFFASYCPSKIIGVTGTRGKSTTSHLIYQVLKENGLSVYLGGRLPGISTIELLKKLKPEDLIVLELSSWDLSGFHQKQISPHISVFTSFYPDHLNYYRSMEDYLYDKKAIFLYQNYHDYLVINQSLLQYIKKLKSKLISYSKEDFPYRLKYLRGEHNQENAAAALRVSQIFGLDYQKSVEIISSFKSLPFRQQVVGEKNNVIFINDTTSTTPVATEKAIKTFSDGRIVLILGGNSKKLPFDQLITQLAKVEAIVLLKGSFTEEILPSLKKRFFKKITQVYDSLKEAVIKGYQIAQKQKEKTYLLFSPAATSFSLFNNEFHRGEEFNRVVRELIETKNEKEKGGEN